MEFSSEPYCNQKKIINKKKINKIKNSYVIQSIIGQTDRHKVHPVQSSVTVGI